ncbi:hypothetical protein BP6252_05952 [Coleophoma cylindrospora]|uniref:Enoyl reductase (ER) domain-containing protein n=1 Tax=Coleophoma cylindrospora TaxID=1849047 RepID=A0A3D8RLI3_9HELO|nr:hypothetical protein BP6252_05952 [Coleophoma cylindrospora]
MKALCVVSKHTYSIARDIPYPSIESPDEIIIKTRAVGLNPIDWKSVDYNFCMPSFPWIGGRELVGVVAQVGTNVKGFKVADRVWASTYYRDRRAGTFQEYVVCPQHTVLMMPSCLSFEEGASLGVAALTAAMTLWKWLDVPMPDRDVASQIPPEYILIWGGSAITGQFAIQLAVQSNLCVIAVTSAKTKALAERLGARHVIVRDGKSNDDIVAEVIAIVGDDLTLAIDLVGDQTGASCVKALSTSKSAILAPVAFLKTDEKIPSNVRVVDVEMKKFVVEKGNQKYGEMLNKLISAGRVVIPEIQVLDGGLEKIEEGLAMHKRGDLGGRKLVVTM